VPQNNDSVIFTNLQDIVQGFTRFNNLYIKHFNFHDEILLREHYEKELDSLAEIPLEEDQLKMLIEKDIWKQSKEGALRKHKLQLSAAETTLPNLLISAQKIPVETKIEELKKKIASLEEEKSEYMGVTREHIANTNSYDHLLCLSIFKDRDFTQPYLPNKEKDLDDLTSEELISLQVGVGDVRVMCSLSNCKKISCSYYIQSMVNCLPEDHEYRFMDRPVNTFTVAQINVVQYCSVFRKIFSKYTIPEEIADDPDKILEFPKQAEKLEKIREKQAGSSDLRSGKSYMGASADEMGDMGMKGVDIHSLLEKSGKKSLSKTDLL
tara:strand:- start:637 stop:1605 length:969 start_codon:yes stop_codon:yes gene_type:complete